MWLISYPFIQTISRGEKRGRGRAEEKEEEEEGYESCRGGDLNGGQGGKVEGYLA